MPTVEFLPYATAGGANVVSQVDYAAASYVQTGRGSGILPSAVYNKINRQGNFVASAVANFISQTLNVDVLDDGNLQGFVDKLTAAIQASGTQNFTTGDGKLTLKTAADSGWVLMNDGTIGDASSGGTTRANADCQALFVLLWNGVTNTYAPVSGGRGASALADWTAHKTIALTKQLGRAIVIAGSGSGLTPYLLGQTFGQETVALLNTNLPATTLTFNGTSQSWTLSGVSEAWTLSGVSEAWAVTGCLVPTGFQHAPGDPGPILGAVGNGSVTVTPHGTTTITPHGTTTVTPAGTISSFGSNVPHENRQPSSAWNIECKL